MTHPFHLLSGKEFELLMRNAVMGRWWVTYRSDDGVVKTIPAS